MAPIIDFDVVNEVAALVATAPSGRPFSSEFVLLVRNQVLFGVDNYYHIERGDTLEQFCFRSIDVCSLIEVEVNTDLRLIKSGAKSE